MKIIVVACKKEKIDVTAPKNTKTSSSEKIAATTLSPWPASAVNPNCCPLISTLNTIWWSYATRGNRRTWSHPTSQPAIRKEFWPKPSDRLMIVYNS